MKTPDKQVILMSYNTVKRIYHPREFNYSNRPQGYQEGNKPLNPLEIWWYKNFTNNIKPDWNN